MGRRPAETPDAATMTRVSARRLLIAVVCSALGYVLNRWRIGTAAPLLLGRIATLPVAILFGPWYGAAAALGAALPATGPFTAAVVLVPVEALVVGAFARRGRSPLLGGVIVWAAIAATLVAVPSLYGIGYLRPSILPVALQVVLSGSSSRTRREQSGGSAATRFTRSCSSPRCRCCCSRPSTAS